MNTTFETACNTLFEHLGKSKLMAFATSADDSVSVRTVNVVPIDGKLYIVTIRTSFKCTQIKKNSNVALCEGATKLTGWATLLGHPMSEQNKELSKRHQAANPTGFARYGKNPDAELIEVSLHTALVLAQKDGKAAGYHINFQDQTAQHIDGRML